MTTIYRILPLALALCIGAGIAACAEPGDEQTVLTEYEDAGNDDGVDAANGDANGAEEDAGNNGDNDDNGGDDNGDSDNDENNADNDNDSDGNGDNDGNADNGDDVCQPVEDGTIRRSEFPVETGAVVSYEFALDVDVDIDGVDDGGTLTWDFEDFGDDDFTDQLEIKDPDDYWFGDEFPDADYATKLSIEEEELGIYQITDDALLLIGLATPHGPNSDDDHTHITYDPAIEVIQFPFEEGDSWSTEVEADGEYAEVSSYTGHDESYEVEIDAAGEIITPYGTFDVLRMYTVREHPTSNIADPCWYNIWLSCDIESRIVSYVAECFGTVARVLSEEDESDHSFDQAAEVMRLAQ